MENYGEYFKALRESKQLTLREVERSTDVSNAYLSQLESGKIRQPSPLTLHKLATFYGVQYEIFMEKVGYPMPQREELIKTNTSTVAYRIGEISEDEEVELLNYLKFIRSRKK
jgi:transcriptional regulator with XRE-family HTH domain